MSSSRATALQPSMSSHEPARPMGHGCEFMSSTWPRRTPASSRASRRNASSTLSHWSTKPAMHVYMPTGCLCPRPRRMRRPSADMINPMATGSVRGYSFPEPPCTWRLAPPSTGTVGWPVLPSNFAVTCQPVMARAMPAIATSSSEASEIIRSRPLHHRSGPASAPGPAARASASDKRAPTSTAKAWQPARAPEALRRGPK
mmetsp:Transcript_60182/g.179203  ORF Transcript_60182/g.179203 Transcript_60182/m.179203 type:complete len:201 (-) Transcript_60182:148-750(-)